MIDNSEFTQIVKNYIDTVYRVALNSLKDPTRADDVTQEVFLRLYKAKNVPVGDEHIKAWLIRVAINECKRVFSSPWNRNVSLDALEFHSSANNLENLEMLELVIKLPPKYRTAVYLHYYEGYSTQEISALLDISQSAVCTRLERARKKLKQILWEAENV